MPLSLSRRRLLVVAVVVTIGWCFRNLHSVCEPTYSYRAPSDRFEREELHNLATFHTFTLTHSTPQSSTANANITQQSNPLAPSISQFQSTNNGSSHTLPSKVVNGIAKFLLFVGYPRSGHSILGSMLDAHPHMIIAHELFLLDEWWSRQEGNHQDITKQLLFDALYDSSYSDASGGWRNNGAAAKGYNLGINSSWQGQYNRTISVIGDKSGGNTAYAYMKSRSKFLARFNRLKRIVGLPVRVIHVVRNPFDIISTNTLYESGKVKYPGLGRGARKVSNYVHTIKTTFLKLKNQTSDTRLLDQVRLDDQPQLDHCIDLFLKMAEAVRDIIAIVEPENVLEIHNAELVSDPASAIVRVCGHLGVKCSEEYLQACTDKTFRTLSISRQYVLWRREQREKVEKSTKNYPYFRQYSFSSST